jgi:hypothetical protein
MRIFLKPNVLEVLPHKILCKSIEVSGHENPSSNSAEYWFSRTWDYTVTFSECSGLAVVRLGFFKAQNRIFCLLMYLPMFFTLFKNPIDSVS